MDVPQDNIPVVVDPRKTDAPVIIPPGFLLVNSRFSVTNHNSLL
jgi:hypothetical protein